MKFRQEMLWTLAVQSFGAGSVLGLVVILGAALGPSAQGLFSRTKAELEFVSALCLFGIPQAAFFFVSTGRLGGVAALRLTGALALLTAALSLAYGCVAGSLKGAPLIFFAVASVLMVVHGVLRVLVLAYSGARAFNLVTVLPQLMLWPLGGVLIVSGDVSSWHVAAGFAFAFLVGILFAIVVMSRSAIGGLEIALPPASLRELLAYSGSAWLAAVFYSGIYIFCIRAIESRAGLDEVGIFTMGMVLVQIVLTPFNYAAPLLFKRWVNSRPGRGESARIAGFSACGASMLSLGLIAIAGLIFGSGEPHAYAQLEGLKWALGGVAVVEAVIRTTGAIANSYGRPWITTLGEVVRFLAITAAISFGFVGESSHAMLSWLLAAALAMTGVLACVVRIQPIALRF